jgi:2-hydroxychromene-2-carboxylate isomerase
MPAAHPMRTVRALRTLLALPHSRWEAAIEALFAAYWQRGEDITSDAVIAAAIGDGAGEALARADDMKDELRKRTDEALAKGIFGAPAWIIGEQLIWGQDRIAWVRAALDGWDLASPPPGGPRKITGNGKPFEAFFDVASPFAYLGLTQIAGIATRLVPILLGGLFREIGQADVPLLAMPQAKQRYVSRDMERWAHWWGVPLAFPKKFPQRTVTAQRLCVVAAEDLGAQLALAQALGRAMWAEGRDLEDQATLKDILASLSLPAAWLDRTKDADVKQGLIANTTEAKTRGVFGVPTWIVDGDQLFWGQDRLELAATWAS